MTSIAQLRHRTKLSLIALVAVRIRAGYVQGPAQFAGVGRTEDNVVGVPLRGELELRVEFQVGGAAGLLLSGGPGQRSQR